MKFSQMKYERPDVAKAMVESHKLMDSMEKAKDSKELFELIKEYYEKGRHIQTMYTLASVRRSINTEDEFYRKEEEYFIENIPGLVEADTRFAKLRLNSPFRSEIEKEFGSYILDKAELAEKLFVPEITEDLSKENKLAVEYENLIASAQIDFDGEKKTLAMMGPYLQHKDREVRRKAFVSLNDWMAEHSNELDRIYDELVKVRDSIAKKLGYENFIPVAYMRMGRTDWNMEDARVYRKQIFDSVVPLAQKYYKEQMERINIKDPKAYDYSLMYLSGNPTPKGKEKELVDKATKMYSELSKETKEFFEVMTENELMDLSAKKGKQAGGYCTAFAEFRVPFIFSNFNGTSGDVDVLTHEAGHAFQFYMSRNIYPDEYQNTSYETAEIHSMSMEFFTHPWMELFFGDETEKYYHSHVLSALNFLPYGASVDEFQEWVYLNPGKTPEERNKKWREIEKKYQPHLDYDGITYLENGGRWQRQPHIYTSPFYYLDYTIAQVCAFQFFTRDLENHKEAWDSYVKLCSLGGTKPFTELIKAVGIENPFNEGSIKKITDKLEAYLETLDRDKIK